MCGRYASARDASELLEKFVVQRDATDQPLEPDYNVAPTKPIPAVLTRRPRTDKSDKSDKSDGAATGAAAGAPGGAGEAAGAGEAEPRPERQLRVVRWGLVPSWAKDVSIGNRLINARIETAHEKPAFRRAFARRRCLLPADGYYEWYVPESERDKKRPRKQPFFIRPADGGVMAMAGLYELWRDESVPDGEPGAWVWSATVITTQAEDDLGRIHDRAPMLVEPEGWDDWLDPALTDPQRVRALLVPASPSHAGSQPSGAVRVAGEKGERPPAGVRARRLDAFPVSTAVNNVANNGPELVDPLPNDDFSGEYAPTLF
jgi:putative SOS response-associated peptidase YedK